MFFINDKISMTSKIIKIYYVLVTSISFIVLCVNIAIFLWLIVKQYLITDEEYITNNNYRIENCEQPTIKSDINTKNQKTEEEIEKCKENTKKEIISQRKYIFKESIIWNLSFIIAFFIIFLFHYIKLKKIKDDK